MHHLMAAVRLDTPPDCWVWPFSTLHSNEYEIRKFTRNSLTEPTTKIKPLPHHIHQQSHAERPPLELLCYSSLVGGGILPPTPLYTINVLCAPKPKNLHQSLLNHLGRNFKFIAVTMRQQTITLTK